MELLSDDDQSNDFGAFQGLRYIFTALGDDRNTLTALAMEAIEGRAVYDTSKEYNIGITCEGCQYFWYVPSEMWICKDCITVYMEIGCLSKVKDGKLEEICKPNHEFIQVPKWDADWLNSVTEGLVPWGDQTITLDKWKQEIRKVYIDLDVSP